MTGDIIYGADDIRRSWGTYYSKLLSTSTSPNFDEPHRLDVEQMVDGISERLMDGNTPQIQFLCDDVRAQCDKLKTGKAAGWDELFAESIRYGGPNLHSTLCNLFNSINIHNYVPRHFRRSVIVPIPKAKDKPKTRKDNYRGISLLSVLAKLYEKLLMPHMLASNMHVSCLQGACQTGCSSLHTALLLRETLSYSRKWEIILI